MNIVAGMYAGWTDHQIIAQWFLHGNGIQTKNTGSLVHEVNKFKTTSTFGRIDKLYQ